MKRGIPNPTAAQKRRFDLMSQIGCIVSRMRGLGFVPGEIHHLTTCGRTISHDHTICLNPFLHRGVPVGGRTAAQCREAFGPSLMDGSKRFHAAHGSDADLLAFQNEALRRVA